VNDNEMKEFDEICEFSLKSLKDMESAITPIKIKQNGLSKALLQLGSEYNTLMPKQFMLRLHERP
jgi:hypothetical protein